MSLGDIQKKYLAKEISKPDYIQQMHAVHTTLFDYSTWLPQTDIASITIQDGEVTMTSRESGIKIVVDRDDKRIAPIEILNFMNYEKHDADMILGLVENGDGVLDIGANIGWYSNTLAKRKPACRILAFEPIPKTFAYLKRNLELNAIKNVEAFNHGFSNEAKELTFYYYPGGSGNASAARLADDAGVVEVKAKVLPLDTFMRDLDFKVDFIKCDVEGAELLVFQGAMETLKKHQPIVFSEMLRKWSAKFDYHPNQIIALFAGLGYRCFAENDGKLKEFVTMTDETAETNFFFMHSQKHAAKIQRLS